VNALSKNTNKILTAILAVGILFSIAACGKNKNEVIDLIIENRGQFPSQHAVDVISLMSDSGITRYRKTAPVWSIFDQADPPFWEFPEGIHLERFDTDMNVDANIRSDYARYFVREELWKLVGNVDAINLEGDRFETERLFWDQRAEQIYSDTIVRVTEVSGVILYGDSFVSDQQLRNAELTNARGDITITEEE